MKVKLVTLNLWLGGMYFENVLDFLKREKPDILNLQEVYDAKDNKLHKRFRTIEEFKIEFEKELPHYIFDEELMDTRNKAPWGNAVFSRFPIVEKDVNFFDTPFGDFDFETTNDSSLAPHNIQRVLLDVEGKPFHVFNMHGIWGTNGDDSARRFEMVQIVTDFIGDRTPAVLSGDMNMDPDNKAVGEIKKKLVSVFGTSLPSTFNLKVKTKPGFAKAAVDMIFVSPDVRVVEKYMPDVEVSDHMPLVVELEI